MPSLSVCMMVQNAEKTLAIALESLGNVYDELIIVDGGSTDSTCEIALNYGAKLIHSKWSENHSQQRNVYLNSVNTDWIFVIDSDEFIDKKTLDYLRSFKDQTTLLESTDNFWLPRKWISSSNKKYYINVLPHYPDFQCRLIKYNKCIHYSGLIHESVHGLAQAGIYLIDLTIFHLDLLINSEEKRHKKVTRYSTNSLQDGLPQYYLPDKNLPLKQWSYNNYLLPSVQILLDALPMICKICELESLKFANAKVLNKYDVDYFQCLKCGFVQTEQPYWLEEAYSKAIASSDVGLVFRNNRFAKLCSNIIFEIFDHNANFLDYGGGYGLFVRLMRDLGFNFYWHDKFCENLFAQWFDINKHNNDHFELVTALEVFEHFINPIDEIQQILKHSKNILFSTELLPPSNPKPDEWWYYVPYEGQHISIYTIKSLSIIAEKFNLNLYSNGASMHLLTEKNLSPLLFDSLSHYEPQELKKISLLQEDYLKAVESFYKSNSNFSITDTKANKDFVTDAEGIKVILDGVFFQLYQTGIARVWASLLEEWAANGFAKHVVVLDRAETAPKIPGLRYRSVQPYDYGRTDTDREMLQQVCDEEGADLFISTYYTTPISTPSVFMAYDMIPEVAGADLSTPMWKEKHYAIQHASAYIAISENTERDLVKFFPGISTKSIAVARCGVKSTFLQANLEEVNCFKTKYGISKSYFVLVGTASGYRDTYKNTILFFKAFCMLYSRQAFDIICTGGGLLEDELRNYTSGSTVHMLKLNDDELRAAYSGAVALVYPSKYEGFGLPVLEAIACGCPVITCPNASIPEVAGEAALYVNDEDVNGLANALCDVQKPNVRNSLIVAGLEQAKKFSWSKMANTVSSALIDATLLPLNLKDINLIIFPDWSQSEDSLCFDLEQVIRAIATHPDRRQMTILVYTENISEEDAALILSSVTINLLLQEDLDVSEESEISLVGQLGEMQWSALLPRIHARIGLENENKQAIAGVKAENTPFCELNNFIDQQSAQLKTGIWDISGLSEIAYFNRGMTLQKQSKYAEAVSSYQKALDIKPDFAEARYQLSRTRYQNQVRLKGYQFTHDWFSNNIPTWEQYLEQFINIPSLNLLEIGSWEGRSTCWLLDNILTHESSKITCIDTFEGSFEHKHNNTYIKSIKQLQSIEDLFDFNIVKTGVSEKVQKIVGKSQEVMRSLPLKSYDIVYIDGSHIASDVLEDAVLVWQLVKVGGFIIFDDYPFTFPQNPAWNTKVGIDAFIEVFKEKSKLIHKAYQVIIEKTS